jgi:ABC-type glutathione transport system ATPase component
MTRSAQSFSPATAITTSIRREPQRQHKWLLLSGYETITGTASPFGCDQEHKARRIGREGSFMNAITVEDIRKIYRGNASEPVHAVDGVSFEVSQGQIYGLLGPNGAGKSTLVKILTTMTAPTSGRASLCGFDVVRQPLDVRRHIAVVLQQTAVETLLTVEDNLRIYAYLHGIGTGEVLKRMDAVLVEFELRDSPLPGHYHWLSFRIMIEHSHYGGSKL